MRSGLCIITDTASCIGMWFDAFADGTNRILPPTAVPNFIGSKFSETALFLLSADLKSNQKR